ncbi:hypothetical protein PPERSA_08380 [Pseudocohnilembus persalinus]|uniref:Uncharacterized protein n=1 Tax=Pseudocohnilembus persalinus TaxID=266149 RepID=A0A0V0R682_PSEPJ|nr:hypothetical protein PPERSA_08380 [Pseudocohnilembus persalinus]|eukprot:KRX09979.1 hypothetical protein PPERSA_08380 [Pseudocohnilembus persalinus]
MKEDDLQSNSIKENSDLIQFQNPHQYWNTNKSIESFDLSKIANNKSEIKKQILTSQDDQKDQLQQNQILNIRQDDNKLQFQQEQPNFQNGSFTNFQKYNTINDLKYDDNNITQNKKINSENHKRSQSVQFHKQQSNQDMINQYLLKDNNRKISQIQNNYQNYKNRKRNNSAIITQLHSSEVDKECIVQQQNLQSSILNQNKNFQIENATKQVQNKNFDKFKGNLQTIESQGSIINQYSSNNNIKKQIDKNQSQLKLAENDLNKNTQSDLLLNESGSPQEEKIINDINQFNSLLNTQTKSQEQQKHENSQNLKNELTNNQQKTNEDKHFQPISQISTEKKQKFTMEQFGDLSQLSQSQLASPKFKSLSQSKNKCFKLNQHSQKNQQQQIQKQLQLSASEYGLEDTQDEKYFTLEFQNLNE